MTTYILATTKSWNLQKFEQARPGLPGQWLVVTDKRDLTSVLLEAIRPRYVFFFHWSAIVPKAVLDKVECVCFHMTDVPFGRGGSPLQNLIAAGKEETVLTALRMTEQLDAGPVYLKRPLSLQGAAHEIFGRAAGQCIDMARDIASTEPIPVPQTGPVTLFKRRTPEESVLPQSGALKTIYDHIRMLDAPTYPPAFIDHGELRITFSDASLGDGEVSARVKLRCRTGDAI
jgi:methionyl-tRNA formyltransferase